jgi:hypothetical protein
MGEEEPELIEQYLDDYYDSDIAPVDRALYDPDIEANWIEMAVSTSVFFPQKKSKRKYIY